MKVIQASLMALRNLLLLEDGQDLVEYSLVFAMIALGSVTGMGALASGLNEVFSTVSSTLTANVQSPLSPTYRRFTTGARLIMLCPISSLIAMSEMGL